MESDQNSPAAVDGGLREILAAVAEARGMALEEAAGATADNFRDFFATSLELMVAGAAASTGSLGVGGRG